MSSFPIVTTTTGFFRHSNKAWCKSHDATRLFLARGLSQPQRPSRSLPLFRGLTTNESNKAAMMSKTIIFAVTREISKEAIPNALSSASTVDISVDMACQQHADYVSTLRKYCQDTIVLPALPDHADCCFVEDTAVVVGNSAVVCQMGHPSRRGEVDSIKAVLQDLGLQIFDMRLDDDDDDSTMMCDGGDVLDTGRHVFVGLSERTSQKGAEYLKKVFRDQHVIPVPFPGSKNPVLHLKTAVTHIDSHTLVVSEGQAKEVLDALQPQQYGYQVVTVPDARCANVLRINDCVLVSQTSCTETQQILHQAVVKDRNLKLEWMDTSEIEKIDGGLTCGSLRLTHLKKKS